jgi:hypothetical protein
MWRVPANSRRKTKRADRLAYRTPTNTIVGTIKANDTTRYVPPRLPNVGFVIAAPPPICVYMAAPTTANVSVMSVATSQSACGKSRGSRISAMKLGSASCPMNV